MKIITSLIAFALAVTAVHATQTENDSSIQGIVKRAPAVCYNGITQCDGCQCCPDGYVCPNANQATCSANTCPKGYAPSSGSGSGSSSSTTTSAPAQPSQTPVNNNGTCTVTSTVYVTSTVGSGSTTAAPTSTTTTSAPVSVPTSTPGGNGTSSPSSHTVTVINKCSYTVWPGILGSTIVQNGGWTLLPGASSSFQLPLKWSGRIWGRAGCNFDSNGRGYCSSGDCGGVLACNGAGGNPPATLAEITFDSPLDFYDVSLVDGYNLPMTFQPVSGTFTGSASGYSCTSAGCVSDLNASCPSELQQVVNGQVVACLSACEKFNTDQYCCRNAYGTPETCKPSTWSTNYAAIFKKACPTAYSYAYDDPTSTFTCTGKPEANYVVTFCG